MTTNYDVQAAAWAGDAPKHLSDWIARPVVLNRIKELGTNKVVLDIGCGTGYFARKMAPFVKQVVAFEKSEKMLDAAINAERTAPLGIQYHQGDMRDMHFIAPESVDICVLNFVLPYIHPDEYPAVFQGLSRVLKPNGKFLVIQGHPLLAYLAPHHKGQKLIAKQFDYKKSRGQYIEFQLKKAGGGIVTVGQYNFMLEDLFSFDASTGLAYQVVKELEVPPGLPAELDATIGEIPYIYLEGIKL